LYENNVFNLLSPDKEISGKAPKEIVDIAEKTAQQVSAFYYLMENLGEIIEDTQGKKNKNKPLEAKTEKKIEEVFEHLGKLGVFFGKTAQSVSNLDFMFGKYAERLRPYQDKFGEELEYEVIAEIFKKNTGKTIEESYASFDKKPLARGSIAQTHTAKLHSGEDVVVKFKRPGLLESLQADTKILTAYFEMMKAIAKDASEVRSLEFIHEQLLGLAEGYASETDFKTEFEILKNLNKRFSNGQIVIPRPYAELSGEDVITMKKLYGVKVHDFLENHPTESELKRFHYNLNRFFIETLAMKRIHGDLHLGNILVLSGQSIGVLDWGQTVGLKNLFLSPILLMTALEQKSYGLAAKALSKMQTKDSEQVSSETIQSFLEDNKVMEKKKIGERLSELGKALSGLSREHKYKMTSDYARILRSFIPMIGTYVSLNQEMGREAHIEALKKMAKPHLLSIPFLFGKHLYQNYKYPLPVAKPFRCMDGFLDLSKR
jgi:ubiquinone biosynthesis protein